MDKIAVLIPCYNESLTIEKVVSDYKEALPEATIYVYDNNSSDHTDELASTHKYKDSREQFEQRTHKRLIDIVTPTQKTVDALSRLEMPAGVYIDIKMKNK